MSRFSLAPGAQADSAACRIRSSTFRVSVELTSGHGTTSLALLRRRDFRTLFLAVSTSELGDALSYIALMWLALDAGGALGVVAVRLADSLPAFFFGLHGGIAADRWSRRKLMIGADLVRAATLIPLAIAGLSGDLPLWALVVGAFVLEAATSYFAPAYGATIPVVVDRAERAAGERARARDGAGAVGRRLGARGADAAVRPGEHVLRDRRGDVPHLGRAARRGSPPVAAVPPRASRPACATASTRCARGARCRSR